MAAGEGATMGGPPGRGASSGMAVWPRGSLGEWRRRGRWRARAPRASGELCWPTALLDARHIAGDRRLTAELLRATLGALAPGGNPNDLIAALAAEKQARHARFGASLYLLEPNLK
jgi:hypothetical protein